MSITFIQSIRVAPLNTLSISILGQSPPGQLPLGQLPLGQLPVGHLPTGQNYFQKQLFLKDSSVLQVCYLAPSKELRSQQGVITTY